MNPLLLKIYDATLSLYEKMCERDCAFAGWTDDEFKQTYYFFAKNYYDSSFMPVFDRMYVDQQHEK